MTCSTKTQLLMSRNPVCELAAYLRTRPEKSWLLVAGRSSGHFAVRSCFEQLAEEGAISLTVFDGYQSNPDYSSVLEGVRLFRERDCDAVAAIGGGSPMDVAKCIRLFAGEELTGDRIPAASEISPLPIPLLAVPTTAGTGSEATSFAVIYLKGEKQSVEHPACVPDAVVLDPSVLAGLPAYQKKATMLDALCHATESSWSVNSTGESRRIAKEAIRSILKHAEGYLAGRTGDAAQMLLAANYAGQAINLTKTTAGHAMSYKLTTLYGIAHGHAAALCVKVLWPYMLTHTDAVCDSRGEVYVKEMFEDLARAYGCASPKEAAARFASLLEELGVGAPEQVPGEAEYAALASSVNLMRLKNHPIALTEEEIRQLYRRIWEG